VNLARVRGTVVATQRSDKVEGARWLLVEDCDPSGAGKGEYLVALDMVGADRGQLVLLTQGSSCRWTTRTDDRPMDTLVVAIVDAIDQGGAVKWPASGAEAAGDAAPAGKDAAATEKAAPAGSGKDARGRKG
jgi:microcompartment protein CcmK/EutM